MIKWKEQRFSDLTTKELYEIFKLRCEVFVVEQESPAVWLFDGGGFGHGAGLSQAGAIDLASRGWSSERILRHYFPGAELQPVKNLSSQVSP